jgi:hypothetical protein
MITFVLGPAFGLDIGLLLPLSLIEGVGVTILISVLAERYIFPMPQD